MQVEKRASEQLMQILRPLFCAIFKSYTENQRIGRTRVKNVVVDEDDFPDLFR